MFASNKKNNIKVCSALISNNSTNHKSAKRLTQIARRVSNRANYLMRKDLFTGRKPDQSKIDKLLKQGKLCRQDKELYCRLPNSVSQRAIQIVGDNWKSFAAAKSDWKKHPEKYKGMPRPPKYNRSAKTVYISCASFSIRDGHIYFAKRLNLTPIPTHFPNQLINPKADTKTVTEIRLTPKGSTFVFEFVYYDFSSNDSQEPLDESSFMAIDLGVNTFAAIVSNQAVFQPILVNGGLLKRINSYYNKRCALLRSNKKHRHIKAVAQKRNRKIKDQIHKISRYIAKLCSIYDIGTVIIGKNKDWKHESSMGKANNQNFTNIPHCQFINMLAYKLKEIGANLVIQEESYTSKASYIDNDPIPTYGKCKTKPKFSGYRKTRGLYKSKISNCLISADLNGAANIARKAGYEGVSLVSRGVGDTPIVINV